MKRITLPLCLLLCLMLVPPAWAAEEVFIPEFNQSFPFKGIRAQEPADDVSLDSLRPEEFGLNTTEEKAPAYHLTKGTETSTPVYLLDSGMAGPTLYILGGTHGDERAGWYAGLLLKNLQVTAGKIYLLPQANILGCEAVNRHVKGSLDLNRAYPGKAQGNPAEQLAHAIYQDIIDKQPVLVLDLHEAAVFTSGRDFLGNKLIFTAPDGMEELFFTLLTAYEEGTLGRFPFAFVGPGEKDSLNDVMTNVGGIPVITVETFRGFPLSHRIQDQVDIVLYCLRFYGMVE